MGKFTPNRDFGKKISDVARIGLRAVGTEYAGDVARVTRSSGARSGIRYFVPGASGKGGTKYTASAPGEPPAVRSGQLAKGTGILVEDRGGRLVLHVGSSAGSSTPGGSPPHGYPYWLEVGTKTMAPRPLWQPTWVARSEHYSDLFTRVTGIRMQFPATIAIEKAA